jgi:hypothetical protein
MGNPYEVHNVLNLPDIGGTVQTYSNGLAEAGKIYPAWDGDRFYYANTYNDCYYILVKAKKEYIGYEGKVFAQDRASFGGDINYGCLTTINWAANKKVIEEFMDLFMGVLSVASGPVAMGITGMNLLVSTGKIVRNYDTYKKAIEVILYNRSFIEKNAPNFYGTVFAELALCQLEKTLTEKGKELLLKAVPGPKPAAKVVGVFLGKVREDGMKSRLDTLNKLLADVLIEVVDHGAKTWPKKITDQQVADLVKYYVNPILTLGQVKVPNFDEKIAKAIVREIADNSLGLQGPFKKIKAALDAT